MTICAEKWCKATFYYDYVLIRFLTDTITATENEIIVKTSKLAKVWFQI